MKRLRRGLLALGVLMGLSVMPFQAQAAEYINITDYIEVMTPVNGLDGQLDVSVTGEAGEDGYLYLIPSVKDMQPSGQVTGENLDDTELEAYSEGSNNYYRIKVKDIGAEASVQASFTCPGYYDVAGKADTNGSENYPISYKFTNTLASKIGKYNITIYVPEGNEVVKVTAPSAYEDYILSEANGLRAAGLSKGLASAAAATLTFTYNKPFMSAGFGKILIWVICLGIGLTVLVDRYKKAKKES